MRWRHHSLHTRLTASRHPSFLSTGSGTECEPKKWNIIWGKRKAESTRRAACQAEAICGSVIQSLTQSFNHSLTATIRQSSNAHRPAHTYTDTHIDRNTRTNTHASAWRKLPLWRLPVCKFTPSTLGQTTTGDLHSGVEQKIAN